MAGSSIITIGNFDGVHLGHCAIIGDARRLGDHHSLEVIVLTFDPHPVTVLRPGTCPCVLTDCSEKVQALQAAGADKVVVLKSEPELLSLSPEQFLKNIVDQHQPFAMVEGIDFRFGKNRSGDINSLRSVGQQLGFEVHMVDPVEVVLNDQIVTVVSSSLVRWLIAQGRVEEAARCLGRSYELSGSVVGGEKRGRTMRVPTVNLNPKSIQGRSVPADGVYVGAVRLEDESSHLAAISIGCQPSFAGTERVVEAHLLEFDRDLYGQAIKVGFGKWLRDQQRFPDQNRLRDQLQRDMNQVRFWQKTCMVDDLSK